MTQENEDLAYPHHTSQISRLNRIAGQVEGIKKMIEQNRPCPDILIQLRAVRSAVKAVEGNILHKHLHCCIADSMSGERKDEKINELQMLFDRFSE